MTGKALNGTNGSPLRQRMIDQMRIANLAESTRYAYVLEVEHLAKHYKASPANLDAEQVRAWVLTLIDKGRSPARPRPMPHSLPSGSCTSTRWGAPIAWPGCAIARSPTRCRAT